MEAGPAQGFAAHPKVVNQKAKFNNPYTSSFGGG
jgi:hypothetical protein